ncbi:MAG TPA: mannose-1-phosphate guanylyltransferase [Candidatus Dormibacteraeota bacterium]|nr:mannose-1-phosphate guanylyltransferase [Candidatus Dormibacteraeota bacterium]
MIIAIIAGGSGSRLWPLSTPGYPKHLLKVNGDSRSLLQNTYHRASQLSHNIYVISETGHVEHVKKQLKELNPENLIIEPARRGTASCILAGLEQIARNHDPEEIIAFLASDHYVRDLAGFKHSLELAEQTSKNEKRIVLVGIEPDHPATGFGYIEKGQLLSNEPFVYNVKSFSEKPNYQTAQKFLKSGNYLWNSGYFVGSLNNFKNKMKSNAPKLFADFNKLANASADNYREVYLSFQNTSIDYALIEKIDDLLVVPASFDWMDLGAYTDLAKAASVDQNGNHIYGQQVAIEEVQNSFIYNLGHKPLAVIGLDNCVVVNNKQGILVTRKDLSQKVGDVSKRLQI